MKALVTSIIASGLLASGVVYAQTKTVTGETQTVNATVEAIDQTRREVTLKKDDGTYEVLNVPTSVKRFDALKVGDTLSVKYYENIVLRAKPTGTMSAQRTITAKITAIDQALPSISFSGPNGWNYTTRVQDKDALAKVKVGDRVDITWTAAAVVAFGEAPKK